LLLGYLDRFSDMILVPHVLAEASNLIRLGVKEPLLARFAARLAAIIMAAGEPGVSSRLAVERPEYLRLGLTDAVLLMLAASGGCLLTADVGLYVAALDAGYAAENFSHIQAQRPDFL